MATRRRPGTARYRRNPEDSYLATLINPKTRELVEVHRRTFATVVMQYPGVPEYELRLGEAYYDRHEVFEVGAGTYVRSHSPSAGVDRGKGFGVVLYAGLCLRAYSDERDAHGIASSDGGTGHSGRSSLADAFWARAVSNDLADETTVEGEVEEKSMRLDSDDYRFSDISCDDTGDSECLGIQSVSGRIDIDYIAGGGEVEVQYMDAADHLADSGLIFDARGLSVELDFPPPPPEVLAGLDLSGCRDPQVAEEILSRILAAGLSSIYVERALSTMPPDVYNLVSTSAQLQLPFAKNGGRRYRPNADVEKVITKVWDEYFGDLQDFPDPEE